MQPEIDTLRQLILGAHEGITEHVKWNAPSFVFNGEDRITFHLRVKTGVQLIFHRGAKVKDTTDFNFEDPSGLMEWVAKDRAVVKFADATAIEAKAEAFQALVRAWVATA